MSVWTDSDEMLPVTAAGYEQRCRELEALRNQARLALAERLRQAREDGDLADNPALYDLLEEQAQLEHRIGSLEAQLAAAEVVTPASDGAAGIGSIVRVRDRDGVTFEYELVGVLESDAENGRVSIGAPVGQALMGRREGAAIEVVTPRGPLPLKVISVRSRTSAEAKAA